MTIEGMLTHKESIYPEECLMGDKSDDRPLGEDSQTLRAPINAARSHAKPHTQVTTLSPISRSQLISQNLILKLTQTYAFMNKIAWDLGPVDLKIEKLKHSPDYRDRCRWWVSALRLPPLFISTRSARRTYLYFITICSQLYLTHTVWLE